MSTNEERCSNCGALNEPGRDTCKQCHQPLTASAESGIRANIDAQGHGGILAPEPHFAPGVEPGMSFPVGAPLGGTMATGDVSGTDRPHEGLPPRRS